MPETAQKTVLTGLTDEEVRSSRAQHGDNSLTPPPRPSMWKCYLEKFEDPVIRVLLVAAALSLLIACIEKEFAETIGIFCAIFLATGIGFWFEYDARRKFDLLNAVNEDTPVTVTRNGKVCEIPRKEVVTGDIVWLNTGEEIPADGWLLEAVSLQVNESALTGELMVHKTVRPADFDQEATYPSNRVLRGTTVTDGHGVMRTDRVGDATEIGKVARSATEDNGTQTPLNQQLERLANLIGKAGFTIATLTFIVFTAKDLWTYFDWHDANGWHTWMDVAGIVLKYFMMAVTLIVVAVPEGLPMSVTLSLALNMRRMLKTNNLVRKIHACETMGAVNVICTDKTGTLTQNLMQVDDCRLDTSDPKRIAEGIAANSTAFLEENDAGTRPTGVGNPTEVALLLWLREQGEDYLALREGAGILHQLTFSTERKYMATLVDSPLTGQRTLYMKGAPEIVMEHCRMTEEDRRQTEQTLLGWQQKAMRTLGLAYRIVKEAEPTDCRQLVEAGELTFLGIVAISDPVRPDVPEAVHRCRQAGIDIKIVTGDTPGTATEIARQIGLWQPDDTERHRITGTEFAAMSDEEALLRVADLKVMSRARPADKQRLVRLLQQKGAVVAVTGDGTNDAPALNRAQVGLSMGSGTSVAKEASDITLLDDSFNSIATAVMWGRSLYKNIQRFIVFQLTINVVALLSVLLGAFCATELPLTVTQMLWVNLIMDTFAAMALASVPPTADVMKERPRRPADFIITPAMRNNILGTGLAFLGLLAGVLIGLGQLPGGMTTHRLTVFFTLFVLLQFWNLFNAGVFGTCHSVFSDARRARGLLGVAALILAGQVVIVTFGGEVFRTEPLSVAEWAGLLAATSAVLWIGELKRAVKRRKN